MTGPDLQPDLKLSVERLSTHFVFKRRPPGRWKDLVAHVCLRSSGKSPRSHPVSRPRPSLHHHSAGFAAGRRARIWLRSGSPAGQTDPGCDPVDLRPTARLRIRAALQIRRNQVPGTRNRGRAGARPLDQLLEMGRGRPCRLKPDRAGARRCPDAHRRAVESRAPARSAARRHPKPDGAAYGLSLQDKVPIPRRAVPTPCRCRDWPAPTI